MIGDRGFHRFRRRKRSSAWACLQPVGHGDKVHIIGHIPPVTQVQAAVNNEWLPGHFAEYAKLMSLFQDTVKGTFMGHIHTEEWMVTRECTGGSSGTEWPCDGAATGMIIPGPALTEGFPARNPAVRLLKFDAVTFELVDMLTYYADIHAANAAGPSATPAWKLEHDFRRRFNMSSLTPRAFERLHAAMATDGSPIWEAYKGRGDGSLYCTSYDGSSAPFAPHTPCEPCTGECKRSWLQFLNGTSATP